MIVCAAKITTMTKLATMATTGGKRTASVPPAELRCRKPAAKALNQPMMV
ncbi:hypothetical protein M8494_00395 [Serratia ureilytica]